MKKTTKILTLLLILAMAALCLISCNTTVDDVGTVTVVIEKRDGAYEAYELSLAELENKSEGAFGLLEALAEREDSHLDYDVTEGAYGKYINSIGSLVPNGASGEYIGIYTSLEKDFDVSEWVKTLEYNGRTLKTSGVGVSELSLEDGVTVLFRIEKY